MKKLSKVKKNPTDPHFWYIFRTGRTFGVSIGRPNSPDSKMVRFFSTADALKDWVKYDMSQVVSPDHVFDASGLRLVSPFYTQWYVENILR